MSNDSFAPLISVIMGVYNNETTLKRAVDSVMAQTYSNLELIMCDDGSRDKSWELMQELAKLDPRIKALKNEKNIGHPATLNRCAEMALGEYIARMDGDDYCMPNRLYEQIKYMMSHPDVGVLGSSVFLTDNDMHTWGLATAHRHPTHFHWALGSCLYHPTVLMKKDVLMKAGGYDTSAVFLEDYELWMRLIASGVRIENLETPLLKYKRSALDFNKQKFKYRIKEMQMRFRCYKRLRVPSIYYLLALKPLVVFFVPRKVLFLIQRMTHQLLIKQS